MNTLHRINNAYRACGRFFFRYRNALFPIVLLSGLIIFPPPVISERLDIILDILGILLIISGQIVRALVIGIAYIKRGGLNKQVYAEDLVTAGMFAHCRNPLYLGNLLIVGGLLVLVDNPWLYLLAGGFYLFAYGAIIYIEEAYLRNRFGEAYENYCRDVPRLGIRFQGLMTTVRNSDFNWHRVITKDYSTMAAWLTGVILLLADKAVHRYGFSAALVLESLLALLVVAGLAYGIRYFKKRGAASRATP